MINNSYFLEIEYNQFYKYRNNVPGDVFMTSRSDDAKIITVLSDGLGSGIKANVLATLSATMASQFIKRNIDICKSARIIIDTLPVCNVRKIGYSTFTVSSIDNNGHVRVIEYDNPPFLLFKNNVYTPVDCENIKIGSSEYKEDSINYYSFNTEFGDRIIFMSDGVTQSGMGKDSTPLGWGTTECIKYIENILQTDPEISARQLSKKIVSKSLQNDDHFPHDDITCAVLYCRQPRKLLVVTGPSIKEENDVIMKEAVAAFPGKKIICGGTTAKIISRELNVPVEVNLCSPRSDVPPEAFMEGVDLVTEGILTLCKVTRILENGLESDYIYDAAYKMAVLLLDSDSIHFIVGTKINEVHQDPNMPIEIEIRRNIIRKIMVILEEKYLKKTELQFI